jgi:hypothetical protein
MKQQEQQLKNNNRKEDACGARAHTSKQLPL